MKHRTPWSAALLCWLLCLALLTACGGSPAEAEPAGSCTVSISCATILDNLDQLNAAKADFVPDDGVILPETELSFTEGDGLRPAPACLPGQWHLHGVQLVAPV